MNRIFVNTKVVQNKVNNFNFKNTRFIIRNMRNISLYNIIIRNDESLIKKLRYCTITIKDSKYINLSNLRLYTNAKFTRIIKPIKEKQKEKYKLNKKFLKCK